ncbi:MAG: phosphoribosylglycinamide synthetase C domain-containing protein [bacterium]
MPMNILIIGSGAKESALIYKLSQSPMVKKIFCIGSNTQIGEIAVSTNIAVDNFSAILDYIYEEDVNLTVVCSKTARAKGLVEFLSKNQQMVIGGNTSIYKFEKSRILTRAFLNKNNIQTTKSESFDNSVLAVTHLQKKKFPVYIKYEGVSEGGGVFFCADKDEARKRIEKCFELSHRSVIIEDYVKGKEIILNVLTDGYNAIPLPSCHVYKRNLDGEGGAYTGGIGAFAPLDFVDAKIEEKLAHKVIFPLIDAITAEGHNFTGVLQTQIIIDGRGELYLLGFKGDFGMIDAQTILPLIDDDLFNLLYATATGALEDFDCIVKTNEAYSVAVQVRSGIIPGKPLKDQKILGLEFFDNDDITIFEEDITFNRFKEKVTNGENVLTAVATGSTLRRAFDNVYSELENLKFKGIYYRKDIAKSYLDYQSLLQDVKM